MQVPLRFDPAIHRLRQGFFGPSSHRLVETNHCRLEPEAMEDTIQSAVSMLNTKLGDVAQPIHHLIVRQSFATQEQMLILCVRQPGVLALDVVRALMNLPHVVTVAETVQPRPHGPVWGKDVRILAGSPHLVERIGPLEFLISPRSFFQVNTAQAEVLYREALAAADVQAEDTVLDAYCGTGTLSLMFASKAQRVVGIETIAAAVHDARKNAKHNGMDNVEFIVGEVERVLPEQIRGGAHYDIALLDPPRKGCHPAVLHSLASARPRKIVYVSCNHVTLARDLRMLADAGYEVSYVQPVDMFPQTGHVECCSLLVRKDVAR
ncbi:hypothetical protein GCM10025857_13750 [Alicyclobacillus contaminans]|nr:hypothetical protein GCM10025857_13750 [Alicyclobacillus contaminans]